MGRKKHDYWKMSKFTKKLLDGVDEDKYSGELFVLRHSPAAREIFASAQLSYAFYVESSDDDELRMFYSTELSCKLESLERFGHDVFHSHKPPKRVYPASRYRYELLAKDLYEPPVLDEWGDEYLYQTILGKTVV